MNICFIGGGNMATAMIGGLLKRGFAPGQLSVVEINTENRERLKSEYGVLVFAEQDQQIIQKSDVIVLSVKPQQLRAVAGQLGPLLSVQKETIVLSIAAGIRLADLMGWLNAPDSSYILVRAMPNTPALIGAGITGLYSLPPNDMLINRHVEQIEAIMSAIGTFVWVRGEEDMDAVTAISGSGPAYFFYFIEALEQAGKEFGLPEQTARQLALETALGAARLAHESPDDPATLRTRVTSKNGTTERALLSMEANHVKQHIIAAAHAAAERSRAMGDELGRG